MRWRPGKYRDGWPSRKAMQHARDRIRFMTMRARLAAPVEQVVWEINLFLRGWAGYFRYGNSTHAFDPRRYAVMRLTLFIAKRHQRGRAWGFAQIYCSGGDLGLISLNGIVVAPRPHRAWRENRTPPVKGVGEPCAGEPHARFDVRGLETERYGVTAPAPDPTQPHRRRSFDSALAETVNGCYKSELIYGACPIRAVQDQIGTRRTEGIGLATAMVKPC